MATEMTKPRAGISLLRKLLLGHFIAGSGEEGYFIEINED